MSRRAVGQLAAVAGVLAVCAVAGSAATASAAAISAGPAASVKLVTAWPARGLGEPAAAEDASVSVVAATTFGAEGARVGIWTRRARAAAWTGAGLLVPAGFGSSYDASTAAAPGGPVLVVVGTAPAGESCIANGSVAIASVGPDGRVGEPRLASDQRGTGSFDDRPAVAVGAAGTVWVAWSQGPDSDACQNVGAGDRLEVAVSHDGGKTFGDPVAMPADGGHSAFGARLAPLSGGRVAVSWTEATGGGGEAVLVSVLGPEGQISGPQPVLTGNGVPLVLPGASFYDFPAGDIVALGGGRLMVAVPFWRSGASVIALAAGVPGGRWIDSVVTPPTGSDLLLPALGLVSAGDVRLLCAIHARQGDRLGYAVANLEAGGQGAIAPAGLTSLTREPAGPGFYEIGEELSLTRTPGGLLASFVVGGGDGGVLETAAFKAPPARPAGAASHITAAPAGLALVTAAGQLAAGRYSRAMAAAAWAAAAVFLCVVFLSVWRLRQR